MTKLIFLVGLVLVTASAIFAQDNSSLERWQQQQQQEKVARHEALKDSPAAKALHVKVVIGESDAILIAAATGDQSLVPYLKFLATKELRTNQNSAGFQAHIALVKLGDEEALTQISEEIIDASPFTQETAIRKLAKAADKKSFRKLYELLNDTAARKWKSQPFSDVIPSFSNNAIAAMYELAQVISDTPVKKSLTPTINDIPLWKAWFAKNKHLIE